LRGRSHYEVAFPVNSTERVRREVPRCGHYLLRAFGGLDPRRYCCGAFLVAGAEPLRTGLPCKRYGKGEAGDSSMRALLAVSIWRAGPSEIFLRGFPRCGGGAATNWPSLSTVRKGRGGRFLVASITCCGHSEGWTLGDILAGLSSLRGRSHYEVAFPVNGTERVRREIPRCGPYWLRAFGGLDPRRYSCGAFLVAGRSRYEVAFPVHGTERVRREIPRCGPYLLRAFGGLDPRRCSCGAFLVAGRSRYEVAFPVHGTERMRREFERLNPRRFGL
jgi:ribosomal protein S27AE